jgi:DNA-binding MarR family transcriptional regulator
MSLIANDTGRQRATTATQEKWGEVARAGFQTVPDLLLKHQKELRISPTEMVVLLNVLMHWWYRDQKPFPRPTTISKRMGVTVRTVQRALSNLQESGLVKRLKGPDGETFLDPTPLVERLGAFTKVDRDYLIRTGGLVA